MTTFEFRDLTPEDFATVADLARRIWIQHYVDATSIVDVAQVDHMLTDRMSHSNLSRYIDSPSRWYHLVVDTATGEPVGYFSYAVQDDTSDMKCEQLYLLDTTRGQGLGRRMIDRVVAKARELYLPRVWLTVNRNNESVKVYERCGFRIRESKVFDIGNGYVMDDYVMELTL